MTSALMPTYARQPIAFVKGSGCWLYDTDGQAYLDALTGIAVCGLGLPMYMMAHTFRHYAFMERVYRAFRNLLDIEGVGKV